MAQVKLGEITQKNQALLEENEGLRRKLRDYFNVVAP